MLNHIDLMGRLCADPELRYTQATQKPVASFRLAVERDFDKERSADFINVAAWNQTAEFVSKYFTKGTVAIVSGRLQIREWTDRNGNKRNEPEIVAEHVYFGESKAKENKSAFNDSTEEPEDIPF